MAQNKVAFLFSLPVFVGRSCMYSAWKGGCCHARQVVNGGELDQLGTGAQLLQSEIWIVLLASSSISMARY